MLFGIVTLLTHTFLYCAAGEIIADQVSYMLCSEVNISIYNFFPHFEIFPNSILNRPS